MEHNRHDLEATHIAHLCEGDLLRVVGHRQSWFRTRDCWSDEVWLSDIEPHFTCTGCGRAAGFQLDKMLVKAMGFR